VEKKQGKKLAGEVRDVIKDVVKDEHVPVKVEYQSLVSIDSGLELVTDLTFPSPAKKPAEKDKELSEIVPATGFSRNSMLAGLHPEKRQEALKKFVIGEPTAVR